MQASTSTENTFSACERVPTLYDKTETGFHSEFPSFSDDLQRHTHFTCFTFKMGLRTEHLVINTYIYYTKYSVYASKQMPEDCKSSFSNNIL